MKPLDEMTHAELYRMRDDPTVDQGMLAPAEHRAFAREWAEESPVIAGMSLPFAIPLYTLAKLLGLQKARSEPSLDELFAGFHGYGEGMLNAMVPSAQAAKRQQSAQSKPKMPPARYDKEAIRQLNDILNETPIVSDSMPPASWHRGLPVRPDADYVDPTMPRGLIHDMPSGSEDRTPQIEPYDYMQFNSDKKKRYGM